MDTSVESNLVPEYSMHGSGSASRINGAASTELTNRSEEQGQERIPVAPRHSTAAKFQIRTAEERQRMLASTKGLKAVHKFEDEKTDNVSAVSTNKRTEVLRVRPRSPPSPNSEERTPRPLNQVCVVKDPELSVGSKTSDVTREKTDHASTRDRGRTEWRGANLTHRSKSLDWRSDREKENQGALFRNTTVSKGIPRTRSESLEENEPVNSQKSKEPTSPSNSVSLKIQAYNAIGQGKQNSNVNNFPKASGSSSGRVGQVALALERAKGGQSLPSRFNMKERQNSTEDRKNPWWQSGHRSSKSDQTEVQLRSQLSKSKDGETAGNQTILDRIGKLYSLTASEDNFDANPRDLIRSKRNSAPVGDWFSSSDAIDSNLNSNDRGSSNDSVLGSPTSSSFSQWRSASNNTEKAGTFPRNKITNNFTSAISVLPNRSVTKDSPSNMAVPTVSTWSKDKPLGKDSTDLMTGNSEWNDKTQSGDSVVLRTHSLDRARSKPSATAMSRAFGTGSSYLACDPNTPCKAVLDTRHESTRKDIERDELVQTMVDNSPNVKVLETSARKQLHGIQQCTLLAKEVSGQPRPQFSRSMTVDCEKRKGNEEKSVLGSSTLPRMKRQSLQEKVQVPSMDSVRSTIHKFEALAQQNQSMSQTPCPRRSLSVPEKPRWVAGVSKSNSDKALSEWKGTWNTRNLGENLFSKSKVCEEGVSHLDMSGPVQITAKDDLTMKTSSDQSKEGKNNNKDDGKMTVRNRHQDEPDFSKASHPNLKSMESSEEKVRNNPNANNKSTGSTDKSHLDQKNLSASQSKCLLTNLQNQGIPPETKDTKTFQTSESASVLADSDSSSSFKPALTTNTAHSKSLPSPLSDSTLTTPVQSIASASCDLNDLYNTTRDAKVAAKVSNWIACKKDGVNASEDDYDDEEEEADEDDEGTEIGDDSDSGESSVTITSNMSQSDHRSFSLSLADLRNLGGLDYSPSDGLGSKDEETWMCRRSASLSSDISVLSSVTLLGTEELDCLLDDVRGLGDDTLQNCEDVQVVVLHKEVGQGLGFTVAGGVDQNKPVTVHRVFSCGAAGQEGSIQEGDQVLSINGTALHNSAHWEALRTLRKARGRGMAVVVLRRGNIAQTRHSTKHEPQKPAGNPGSTVRVTLNKSSSDLGFSLEGGVGSSLGDRPLTVQRLFQGGPVGKVFPGDELLEVQGQSLEGLRRLEAWKLIKRLPGGPVEVVLHRPHLPH